MMKGKRIDFRPALYTSLVASLFLFLGFSALSEEPGQDGEPLPFDPLSSEEQAAAIELALGDDEVGDLLSDRHEVIGAALFTDKSFRELEVWPRMAEVWLYDYGHNQAVRAQVDLSEQTVGHVDVPGVQPPVTWGEVHRAGSMALGDPEVHERFAQEETDPGEVEWTGRLWTGDGPTACPEHRCVLVGFIDGDVFLHDFTVLVDLVLDEVIDVLGEHGADEPEGGLL